MHQLVDDHVVAHPVGHRNEPPVQADMTRTRARSPSPALIADADACNRQVVNTGEIVYARRQFAFRAFDKLPLGQTVAIGRNRPEHGMREVDEAARLLVLQAAKLLVDPSSLAFGERRRFFGRAPTRQRHSNRVLVDHSHNVAACPGMADENRDGPSRRGNMERRFWCGCRQGAGARRETRRRRLGPGIEDKCQLIGGRCLFQWPPYTT